MRNTSRQLLGLAAALLIGTSAALPATAAEITIRIGWATTDSETDAYNYAAHRFADALEAAAPGRFEVAFFPNRQLGDERELLQGMQLGTVDSGLVTNSVIGNVEPAFLLNDMPFLYTNSAQAHGVLDGELGQVLFDKLAAKNVVGLAWCESGFRNMINNVRPVTAPADVEGVKYRVMESPIFIGMYDNLGGSAVPMAWGDVFTGMQQGTIDGLEIPTWVVDAAKLYEVTHFLSFTRHVYTATPILMSARLFDSMSAEDQQTVKAAARTACDQQRAFNIEQEAKIVEGLKGKGMEVNEVPDPAQFRDKMKPVYEQYRDQVGSDLMDQWLAAVAN